MQHPNTGGTRDHAHLTHRYRSDTYPEGTLIGMALSLVIVDDHPSVRTGLQTLLHDEPDLEVAASAANARDGFNAIAELQPLVAVVDYQLPDQDGFTLCLRTHTLPKPPRIIVYSAFATPRHAVLAAVAGAGALLSKSAAPEDLLAGIRADGSPPHWRGRISPDALRDAAARLEPADLAILGMLAHDVPPTEIAATLSMDARGLLARRWAMLERLAGKPSRRPRRRSAAGARRMQTAPPARATYGPIRM